MYRIRCIAISKLRGCEIEAQSVGSRHQIDQGFEMRSRHGPVGRRQLVVEPAHGEVAFQSLGCGVCNCAIHRQYFLVYLTEY